LLPIIAFLALRGLLDYQLLKLNGKFFGLKFAALHYAEDRHNRGYIQSEKRMASQQLA
jgi:hypothetical protein